jgi:hypothetical protein
MTTEIKIKDSGIWAIVWITIISAIIISASLDEVARAINNQTKVIQSIHEN